MFYAFGILIMVCETGDRNTNAFEPIQGVLEEFDWLSFPLELQRKLPMIWAMAQKPVTLKCFGRISCNRESFKKVILI